MAAISSSVSPQVFSGSGSEPQRQVDDDQKTLAEKTFRVADTIIDAMRKGDYDETLSLINTRPENIFLPDENGFTVLHIALLKLIDSYPWQDETSLRRSPAEIRNKIQRGGIREAVEFQNAQRLPPLEMVKKLEEICLLTLEKLSKQFPERAIQVLDQELFDGNRSLHLAANIRQKGDGGYSEIDYNEIATEILKIFRMEADSVLLINRRNDKDETPFQIAVRNNLIISAVRTIEVSLEKEEFEELIPEYKWTVPIPPMPPFLDNDFWKQLQKTFYEDGYELSDDLFPSGGCADFCDDLKKRLQEQYEGIVKGNTIELTIDGEKWNLQVIRSAPPKAPVEYHYYLVLSNEKEEWIVDPTYKQFVGKQMPKIDDDDDDTLEQTKYPIDDPYNLYLLTRFPSILIMKQPDIKDFVKALSRQAEDPRIKKYAKFWQPSDSPNIEVINPTIYLPDNEEGLL